MKAVIFSDLHLHNFKAYSRILDNGINSRLQDGINILKQILDYCIDNKIKVVFFGGDFFHNGASLSPDILTVAIEQLKEFLDCNIFIRAISGQHDNLNAQFHGLNPLSDYLEILPDCGVDKLHWRNGLDVWTCYHRRGIENQKEALKKIKVKEGVKSIFIGHFLLKEILEATGVPYANQAVEFEDLPRGCDHYFLGDYHPHVYLPDLKVMSVGSTHHHTWNSKNKPPGGFIVMDFDTGEFERVLLKAPMFIEIDCNEEAPSNLWVTLEDFPSQYWKGNFFRIKVESIEQRDMIKANLDDSWHVEFVFDSVEAKEEVTPDDRPDIHFNLQPYDVITKYLQHKDRDPELAREGMKYVREERMKFGYLVIENFFRIKSLSINLANPGLFAVLGKNLDTGESNEAGKSTIFEALCWCLWGRYAAGGARAGDEVVNPEVVKDCYVSVEIWDGEDRYMIVRTRNHTAFGSQLCIEKENLEGQDYKETIQLTARNVKSTTKLIEDILGMNYETFVRGYYFPQEGVQSFGFMTDRGLKDFFLTELLDLSWIEDAHEKAKAHHRDLLEEQKNIERGREHANNRLEGLDLQIATLTLKGNGWIEDRNEKLKELGKEIRNEKEKLELITENSEAIGKKIEEIERSIAVLGADRDWSIILGKCESKYLKYVADVSSLEPKVETLKAEIEECTLQLEQVDDLPGTNCNECGSFLDHSHLKFIKPKLVQRSRDLKSKWEALMMPDGKHGDSYQMKVRERDALEKEIEGLKKKMEEQKEKDKQIVELKEKLNSLENAANVEFIHRTINDRKRQMVEKAKEKNPYVELLEDAENKIKETNNKIVELDDQHARISATLSDVEFWVEAFSAQGIQSFVLDSVTHQLNKLIASYLVELSDGRISARFSTVTQNASGEWREKFKLEINNMDGGNSYTSLSGGAKRRVDVAVALAVSEYKRSHTLKELEFLVLDEATSGMDQYWTERFVTLLKNRLTNSAKYFITHQQLNSSWFDDTVIVIKRNGETILLEV